MERDSADGVPRGGGNPPESLHFVSVGTLPEAVRQRRRDAPPRPQGGAVGPGELGPQWADALAVARVYRWWTGEGGAPWARAGADEPAGRGGAPRRSYRKRAAVRYKVNPLARFHADMHFAIARAPLLAPAPAGPGERVEFLPFCGRVGAARCGGVGAPAPPASGKRPRTQDELNAAQVDGVRLRVLLVFWAPSYLAAKHQTTSIPSTAEAIAIRLLERFLNHYGVRAVVSVAYVLPRYARAPYEARQAAPARARAHRDRYAETPPAVLAYGAWQLGVAVTMVRPHVILTTCRASSRVVGCSGGLDLGCFASEATKAALAQQPVPGLYAPPPAPEAAASAAPRRAGATPRPKPLSEADADIELPAPLPAVRRTLQNLVTPNAPPRTLRHPDPRLVSRGGAARLYLLRVPHPLQLQRALVAGAGAGSGAEIRHNQVCFTRAVHAIVRIDRERTTTPDVPARRATLPLSRHSPPTATATSTEEPARKRARRNEDRVEDIESDE